MIVIAAIYFVLPTRASKVITFFRLAIAFIVCERIPRCLIFCSLILSNLFEVHFPIHPMVCHTDISELLRIYNGDDVMIVLYQLSGQRYIVAIGLCNSNQCAVLTCSPTLNSRTVCGIFENFSCIFNAVFI